MFGASNQNPEQQARDLIDAQLRAAGWVVQDKKTFNLHDGEGQAIREYHTDTGPADYVLFVDGKPVGVIEAKKEDLGHNLTAVENQTVEYSVSKLKWIQKTGVPLPFLYEATGVVTRFTDQRDPKPRSREVFSFLTAGDAARLDFPRPRGSAENPHLRQDGFPCRRHHPDRARGVR